MINTAIKYFFICLCYLTVFTKLLNIKEANKNHLLKICFAIFFAASAVIFRTYFFNLSILLLYALILIYTYFVYKKGDNITITSSIIAFGISYCLFTISAFLIAPTAFIFNSLCEEPAFIATSNLLVGIIENILALLLFKIKRLKNGMPFLLKKGNSDIGVFISVTLLIAITFIPDRLHNRIRFVCLFVLLISTLIIYLWWRKKLYSDYLKKLKENDISTLKQAIESQEETIAKLTATNEEMLKIIQKDNKLIPEMQVAVNDLIAKNKTDETEELQAQLNTLHDQRLEVLNEYETNYKEE